VADALEAGTLGGYAADVFALEDWARDDRPRTIAPRLLAAVDCTLFTPHLGSAVADVRREIELHAARQIEQALSGRRPDGAVNDLA
jgi:phosphonate dehydrogenase